MHIRNKKLFFISLAMVFAGGVWIFHDREGYVATYHMLGFLGTLAFVSTLILYTFVRGRKTLVG